MKISGMFDVSLNPLESDLEVKNGLNFGMIAIDKTFHGTLNARSKDQMLNASTAIKDSAGYVAIEKVSGNLDGKDGSFLLQHYGIMNRGKNQLLLEVIPDSGTGRLTGTSGKMDIFVKDGKHLYVFEYTFN